MDKIKLKELIKKAVALKEKKNAVGKVPSIGLTIHVDSTFDPETKQLNIKVSNQTGKSPEYIVPDMEESGVQEVVSGLESELAAVIRSFSKSIEKVLSKYQQQ